MYRLLIFAVALTTVLSKHSDKRDRYHPLQYPEEAFHKLAHRLISTERKFENTCRVSMHNQAREVYDEDRYVLKYFIQGFEPKDFLVKVMHRAMYVSAQRWESTGMNTFWDLKILPDNLRLDAASWTTKEDELQITFPYKTPLGTEFRKSCGNNNYAYVTVPMAPAQSGNVTVS